MTDEQKTNRCKHERIWIVESGVWITEHNREKDGMWGHEHTPGSYNSKIIASCFDCKREWKYSRGNVPKWLKRYMDEIGI